MAPAAATPEDDPYDSAHVAGETSEFALLAGGGFDRRGEDGSAAAGADGADVLHAWLSRCAMKVPLGGGGEMRSGAESG